MAGEGKGGYDFLCHAGTAGVGKGKRQGQGQEQGQGKEQGPSWVPTQKERFDARVDHLNHVMFQAEALTNSIVKLRAEFEEIRFGPTITVWSGNGEALVAKQPPLQPQLQQQPLVPKVQPQP